MNMVIGLLASLFFLIGFFLLFKIAFHLAFGKNFIKKHFKKNFWITFSVVAAIGLVVILYFTSQNSGIYCWDSSGYWTWSYKHTNTLYGQPFQALGNLYTSITDTDYNLILPTIISFPLKIFGYTFLRYVSINYLIFLVPSLFISICILVKLFSKARTKFSIWKIALFAAICLPVSLISILQGYIDVAVLIPINLVFALTIDYNPLELNKKQIIRGIMIGLMLVTMFLFRRYTAFFIMGYAIILFMYTIFCLFKNRTKTNLKLLIKKAILNFLAIGGTSLIILLGFFSKLVFRIIKEDYSVLYSAYDGTFIEKMLGLVIHFGIVIIVITILGIILSCKKKEHLKMIFFFGASIPVIALLFFRVQRMDGHHIYTLTVQTFILLSIGIYYLFTISKKTWTKILSIFCCVLLIFGSLFCISDRIYNKFSAVSLAFEKHYTNVLKRFDTAELHALKDYLNSKSNDKIIYVLSSSIVFNSDTLMVMDRPSSENAVNGLVKTHDVDLRDGFPSIFFDADIIVTTTPIGLHLREGSQEIVRYLAEKVQDSSSFLGRHYQKDAREFTLQEGYTVQIYYKTSALKDQDYLEIEQYYDNLYPDQKPIFKDRIEAARLKSS